MYFLMYNHLRQADCYPSSREGKGDKAICVKFRAGIIESVITYDKHMMSNEDILSFVLNSPQP